MSVLRAVVLGAVQGLTEFLPVSSSGHLQVIPWLLGWEDFADEPDLGLAFDIAVHVGTLAGAVVFFARDLASYLTQGVALLSGAFKRSGKHGVEKAAAETRHGLESKMIWLLLLASLPAAFTGVLLESFLASDDHIWLTALCLAGFGLLLAAVDRRPQTRDESSFSWKDALAMGAGQALALQPGVSRSGATISVARWRGLDRPSATRLSFLMSLPIIAGAGLYKLYDLGGLSAIPADSRAAFAAGMVSAAVTGWFAIWGFLRLVSVISFAAVARYRVLLGLGILALVMAGH